MNADFRNRHADRVVLVTSNDSGLATGRLLAAQGATVLIVEPTARFGNTNTSAVGTRKLVYGSVT